MKTFQIYTCLGLFTFGFLYSTLGEAQISNLSRLRSFQGETVAQQGRNRAALESHLEKIVLPLGFRIELFAIVPDARHMAVGSDVGAIFVGTRKTKVWVVTDRNQDGRADEVKAFAPSFSLSIPNGPCFSEDGFLFIAEHNRVLVFPAAEFFYEGPEVVVDIVVPQGKLIPISEESFNHGARVCRIGPDNKLYIALGQPYNVPPSNKLKLYNQWGIGGIIRMNRDGTDREVYTYGIRNSVGIEFHPESDNLWFTDNQVDGMGDDIPPGELNCTTRQGEHFGFPWYGGGDTRTKEYLNATPPSEVVFPQVNAIAHAADLGLVVYQGQSFPEEYHGGIFSAQHGSWNRTTPVGARIMFTPVTGQCTAGEMVPFAEGWLDKDTGWYTGRPVDVAVLQDGSLLVSDDFAGAIYRIFYAQ